MNLTPLLTSLAAICVSALCVSNPAFAGEPFDDKAAP
jgi:hypothetical protein